MIGQTITNLPTAPSLSDPANFDSRADAFLGALNTFDTEMNTAITEINSTATDINTQAAEVETNYLATLGAANYQSDYNAATIYSKGQSVSYNGKLYASKINSNVGNTPDVSTDQWFEMVTHQNKVKLSDANNISIIKCDFDASSYANYKYLELEISNVTLNGYGMKMGIVFNNSFTANYRSLVSDFNSAQSATVETNNSGKTVIELFNNGLSAAVRISGTVRIYNYAGTFYVKSNLIGTAGSNGLIKYDVDGHFENAIALSTIDLYGLTGADAQSNSAISNLTETKLFGIVE